LIALRYFDTGKLVIISTLGAVVLYVISMVSLFVLRRKEPGLHRPFKAPFYPYFPAAALILSLVAGASIVYFYPWLSLLFFGGLGILLILFYVSGKYKEGIDHDASFTELIP